MTSNGIENDPLFAAIAALKTHDVHHRRRDALRRRCHTRLRMRSQGNPSPSLLARVSFRRAVAPAVALVWCVVYLIGIIHRAAVVHRF
ncbi:MAG TPA: hypothetical protein VL882_05565 [Vicinamibacterales bacterium]|jgi:hypothetical protein|nr:hypothetical protein [Vicinamibacterales bacterium]